MPKLDLKALPFKEAQSHFESLGLSPAFDYKQAAAAAAKRAFAIAGVTKLDMLEDMKEAVDEALEKGLAFEDFRNQAREILADRGWTGPRPVVDPITGKSRSVDLNEAWRLKAVYQTNLMSAFNAGRDDQIGEVARERYKRTKKKTYLRLVGVQDDHTCDVCDEYLSMNNGQGLTAPYDSPIWDEITPPLHYCDRCTIESFGEDEAPILGYKTSYKLPQVKKEGYVSKRSGEKWEGPRGVQPGFGRRNYDAELNKIFTERSKRVAKLTKTKGKITKQSQLATHGGPGSGILGHTTPEPLTPEVSRPAHANWVEGKGGTFNDLMKAHGAKLMPKSPNKHHMRVSDSPKNFDKGQWHSIFAHGEHTYVHLLPDKGWEYWIPDTSNSFHWLDDSGKDVDDLNDVIEREIGSGRGEVDASPISENSRELPRLAVRCLIVEDGKVLIFIRSDEPYVMLPGGGVEQDESLIDAAKREAKEETGFEVEPYGEVLGSFDNEYGRRRFLLVKRVGGEAATSDEGDGVRVTVRFIPIARALDTLTSEFDRAALDAFVANQYEEFATHAYLEEQHPRDAHGKWTVSGGGGLNKVGPAKGSNPGGVYEDSNLTKYYGKFYSNPAQYEAEIGAQYAYRALGVPTADSKVTNINGKQGLLSPIVPTVEVGKLALQAWVKNQPEDAARVFVASIITQNWDVVGLGYDNLMVIGGDKAKIGVIDTGGSFTFRAKGGSKPYNTEATEFDTLRAPNGKNPQAGAVFEHVLDTSEGRQAAFEAVDKLSAFYANGTLKIPTGVTKEQIDAKCKSIAKHLYMMPPVGEALSVDETKVISDGMKPSTAVNSEGEVDLDAVKYGVEKAENGFILGKIKKGSGLSIEHTGVANPTQHGSAAYQAFELMKECKTVDEYYDKAIAIKTKPGWALNRLKQAAKAGFVKVTNAEGLAIKHQYAQKLATEMSMFKSLKTASQIKTEQAVEHVASAPSRSAMLQAAWATKASQMALTKTSGSRNYLRAHIMPDEVNAIVGYSDGHYASINTALAAGEVPKAAKVLALALSYHPDKYIGKTWRRDSLEHYPKSKFNFATMKAGEVIENPCFWSTTKNSRDNDRSSSLVWHITEGKTGVDIQKLSNYNSEAEVLFKPHTKYEFVKAESFPSSYNPNSLIWHVHVKEIGEGGI